MIQYFEKAQQKIQTKSDFWFQLIDEESWKEVVPTPTGKKKSRKMQINSYSGTYLKTHGLGSSHSKI